MATMHKVLHVLSPAAVLTCYIASSLWETITTQEDECPTSETVESSASSTTPKVSVIKRQPHLTSLQVLQRGLELAFSAFIGLLYAAEAIALACSQVPARAPGTADEGIVFALFSSLVWLVLLLSLLDVGVAPKGRSFRVTWIVAASFEAIVLCVGLGLPTEYSHHVRVAQIVLQSSRTSINLVLIASEFLTHPAHEVAVDEEREPLLLGAALKDDSKTNADNGDKKEDQDLRRISKT